jgi:sortase A
MKEPGEYLPGSSGYKSISKIMQFKTTLRRVVVSIILIGIIGVPFLYIFLNKEDVTQEVDGEFVLETVSHSSTDSFGPELPIRLTIPKINLDAEIEYVGVTPDGEMATPENVENVGWYEPGVRPGEAGSAVFAGHYGWEGGKPSAFDELHKLRVGDKIYVEDAKGTVTSFVVRANRRYAGGEEVPEVFSSDDGIPHLNLITCEGDWDPISRSYSSRLVVFTDRE